jgi:8-oxo-dGTP pyrophosphatase MutT (NUDIX family)
MAVPDFVVELRRHVGTVPLWLIGCTAVVLRPGAPDPEMLIVKRADNGAWTPITGVVDPGEHPMVAAVRETMEEAAITTRVQRLAQVGVTGMVRHPNGDRTQYLDLTFRCEYVSGEPFPADGENSVARWISTAALGSLVPPISRHMLMRIDAALSGEREPRLVTVESD